MLEHIVNYLKLQKYLLNCFREKFGELTENSIFFEIERHGDVFCESNFWNYSIHGSGVLFENEAGVIVDVHNSLSDPNLLDAHRLASYLESISENPDTFIDEHSLVLILNQLVAEGALDKIQGRANEFYLTSPIG